MSAENIFPLPQDKFDFAKSLRSAGEPKQAVDYLVTEAEQYTQPEPDLNKYPYQELKKMVDFGHFVVGTELTLAARTSVWDKMKQTSFWETVAIPIEDIANEGLDHLGTARQAMTTVHNHPRVQELASKDGKVDLDLERDRLDFLIITGQITGNPMILELAIKKMDQLIANTQDQPLVKKTLEFEKTRLNYANELAPFKDLKQAYLQASTEAKSVRDWQTLADLSTSYIRDSGSIFRHPLEMSRAVADRNLAISKDKKVSGNLADERADRILTTQRRIFWDTVKDLVKGSNISVVQVIFEAPVKTTEPVKEAVKPVKKEEPQKPALKSPANKKPDYVVDLQKIFMGMDKTSPTTIEAGAEIRVKLTVPERLITIFDGAKHFVKPEYKSKSGGLIYERSY